MPIITPNQISKTKVIYKFKTACKRFLDRDFYLLNVKANERSMTHKLAEYFSQD